jgi:hypothetical protein
MDDHKRKGNIVLETVHFFCCRLINPPPLSKLFNMTAQGDFFVQRPYLFPSLSSPYAACLIRLTAGEIVADK